LIPRSSRRAFGRRCLARRLFGRKDGSVKLTSPILSPQELRRCHIIPSHLRLNPLPARIGVANCFGALCRRITPWAAIREAVLLQLHIAAYTSPPLQAFLPVFNKLIL
jgi:hypothetical protein